MWDTITSQALANGYAQRDFSSPSVGHLPDFHKVAQEICFSRY
jgi:hypothetical protein